MTSTTLTIDQLRLSPHNVRTNQADATATSGIERSIPKVGLIYPLVVHPMLGTRRKPLYGVHAGGRRYRAICALVERGELPADWPVPVIVREGKSDAELIEESQIENLLRRDLRPSENFAAVARAHRKGHSVEQIAETLGQELTWVRRHLRLGNLAAPVFKALEDERITVEQAKAYAATDDHALQVAAFEAMAKIHETERSPERIRSWLKVGDARALRLLRFVGDETYRAAGGRFELDLFAESADERGRVVDLPLLERLAEDATEGKRAELRDATGRPNLRFVPQPPLGEYGVDHTLQVTSRIEDGRIELPDGDIVGHLSIREDGEIATSWWWSSRKAKHGRPSEKAAAPPRAGEAEALAVQHSDEFGVKRRIDAAIREDAGLTTDMIQVLRSMRRAALRALLVGAAREPVSSGDLATDYLVWSQLRAALSDMGRVPQLGIRTLPTESYVGVGQGFEKARPHVAATTASREWGQAIAELQGKAFVTSADLTIAFEAYRVAPPLLKRLAGAVVAGWALERSLNADGYRLAIHDQLAADAGVDQQRLRALLPPTAELLAELTKSEQLAIAEPLVESSTFATWSRLKATQLTARVLGALTGREPAIRKSMTAAAATWVHPLLRFGPDEPIGDDVEPALEAQA